MNNKSIHKLNNTKKEYQNKLNEILKKYFIRYIEKLYSDCDSYKDFQRELLKIPEWSYDKSVKEYDKFLKYTKEKFDLSEDELIKILDIIFGLNIKIMTSLFDEIELNIPKFNIFWFKCLKRIGKYYYENPKKSLEKPSSNKLNDSIEYVIQKYIPLKDIINSTHKELEYYNFDNINTDIENHITNDKSSKINISLESTDNENSLQYIKSEDFENEYYKSDKSENELSQEKHINIPKYLYQNRNIKNGNKISNFKKKNELDEHFFDEF